MIVFTKYFFIFILLFFLLTDFFFSFEEEFSIHNWYVIFFSSVIFLNYKINYNNKYFDLNLDLLYKFLSLLFKTPNFLYNYFINIFKKIYIFLIYFKTRYLKNTFKLMFKKYFNNLFITWRPLFKKTSYFGYYRSNRSKWIK